MVQEVCIRPRIKILAQVKISNEATPEEMQAIKDLFRNSGLIVEFDGRVITLASLTND